MPPRVKDSQKSRADILAAAEAEFSELGLHGARVDRIAERAAINKRMIYEYYGNKVELYKTVLVEVYNRLSRLELIVLSKEASSTEKIRGMVRLYFEFLHANPTYVNLILWENLNQGKYIREIDISAIKRPGFERFRRTIEQGKQEGAFRCDLDTEQLLLSLLTYTFSYFSNRYTLSRLLGKELDEDAQIQERIENVTDMFLCYMKA